MYTVRREEGGDPLNRGGAESTIVAFEVGLTLLSFLLLVFIKLTYCNLLLLVIIMYLHDLLK